MLQGLAFHLFYVSNEESKEKTRREAFEVLKIVEDQALKDKEFFGGDRIGMVDIIYGSLPHWFEAMEENVGVKVLEPNTLPRLYAWAQRFKQVPVIEHNLPPYQDLLLHFKRIRQVLTSQAPNAST